MQRLLSHNSRIILSRNLTIPGLNVLHVVFRVAVISPSFITASFLLSERMKEKCECDPDYLENTVIAMEERICAMGVQKLLYTKYQNASYHEYLFMMHVGQYFHLGNSV